MKRHQIHCGLQHKTSGRQDTQCVTINKNILKIIYIYIDFIINIKNKKKNAY